MEGKSNGMAVAALICGILGMIGSFIPVVMYFTAILAVLGIVFGVKGKRIARESNTGMGLATAGLVLGIIGTVCAASGILCALACAGSLGSLASLAGLGL